MRPARIARIGWGSALLLCPQPVLRLMGVDPSSRGWRTVARVLGLRHLLQAWVASGRDNRRTAIVASIDAVHATSALGFAALSRRYRRVACVDGAIATMFAVSTATESRSRDLAFRARPS